MKAEDKTPFDKAFPEVRTALERVREARRKVLTGEISPEEAQAIHSKAKASLKEARKKMAATRLAPKMVDFEVEKAVDDRELQRKVVLGADAVVSGAVTEFWQIAKIVILIMLGLWVLAIWMEQRQKHFANPYEKPDYSTDLGLGHR
jgi:hypothetical protein